MISGDTFTVFGGLEGFLKDALDILHSLDTLSHAEAEISEPLVVHGDSPVLAEELNDVRNDSLVVSRGHGVEVVLMETYECPKTLEDDFLATHVSDRVDDTNTVEGKLDEVTLFGFNVEIVTSQRRSVLNFLLIWVKNQWVGSLDAVEQDVSWKNTALSLRQVEAWKLFFHAFLLGVGVVDIEHTSSQSRSHLSSIVTVHSQWSSLTKSFVSSREFTDATSSEDGRVSSLEVLVNNQSAIVNETVVVNRGEHILVDISMSGSNQDSALNLLLILLSLLLLFDKVSFLLSAIVTAVLASSSITAAHV